MNRRSFFGAVATALVVPVAPRRVYSFLWDSPLVKVVPYDIETFEHSIFNWVPGPGGEVVIRPSGRANISEEAFRVLFFGESLGVKAIKAAVMKRAIRGV